MSDEKDYGEPWRHQATRKGTLIDRSVEKDAHHGIDLIMSGSMEAEFYGMRFEERAERALACVNALRGVADPAEFVKAADALEVWLAILVTRSASAERDHLLSVLDAYRSARGAARLPGEAAPPKVCDTCEGKEDPGAGPCPACGGETRMGAGQK